MNKLTVIRRESTVTLLREALWRTQRRWKQARFSSQVADIQCEVEYSPVGYYRPTLDLISESTRSIILRYADCICLGDFPWFGYGRVNLGLPPRWNLDFVSGKDWPRTAAADLAVVRHDGSDVKVPWELSRMQFLPVLGKAWLLTGDVRYRAISRNLLSDWISENPIGQGINWTIAMEAALRAMSICLSLELLWPFPAAEYEWLRKVTNSLWEHLLYIEAHNEFSHLVRSNHYLSNITGLFCLSIFLNGPQMATRRKLYGNLVQREILQQVHQDGGDYEASTGYQVLVLQMFTSAFLLMRAQGHRPSADFLRRLRNMYKFLGTMADETGCLPQAGDCDDGRVELLTDDLEQMLRTNLSARNSLAISGLMGIGGAIFGEDYRGQRDEPAWYGAMPDSPEQKEPERLSQRAIVFPNSGLAIARNSQAKVIFVAMPNGIEGRGSHTHNDKLSLIIWIRGQEFLVDCGTGCYTRDAELRNRLRATSAHNTVQIDGQEQNRFSKSPSALFRICNDAHVNPILMKEVDNHVLFQASHDGYRRLGVQHRRAVKLMSENLLIVNDELSGTGGHSFDVLFHLPKKWQVVIRQTAGQRVCCSIQGPHTVAMECHAPVPLQLICIPGIISRAYGAVEEATTIVVSGQFGQSVKLASQISWAA